MTRDALKHAFDGLIDIGDVTNPSPVERERNFLSRALAALVVRDRVGCSHAEAAEMVIDGRDDLGIDAVAVGDGVPRLWLVQSKWSAKGEAGIGVGEVLKLVEGLRMIDQQEFHRFNLKFQGLTERVKDVLQRHNTRITLVIVLMGDQDISTDVRQRLVDACADFNRFGEMLNFEIILAPDIQQILRHSVSEPAIDLEVKMESWFNVKVPFSAYSGMVPAGEVAQWYSDHGDRLFTQNIRRSLGVTTVNAGMVETLAASPHNFWYFNNGITVLCESFDVIPYSYSAPHGPATLRVHGASVVNGAQTVAAAFEATSRDSMLAGLGYVGVRVISVGQAPEELAVQITQATNTQNHVERRDFVALDRVQLEIKDEFVLTIGKTYVVKRGELDPPPDLGCSVVHAAVALACAHSNPELAVRAKRDPDLLWERGSKGAYTILFDRRPPAIQIWRSVQALRAVQQALHEGRDNRQRRAAAIADHSDLLVAHVVFQLLDASGIDDLDSDWDSLITGIPELVGRVVDWLVFHVDALFGPTSFIVSTFTSPERCQMLVENVLKDISEGTVPPELPAEYRTPKPISRSRRPNTVALLVDAQRIKDGRTLLFSAGSEPEQRALADWLAANPNRSRATWVNDRSKPLLWSEDRKRYSPSGLVKRIWALAEWKSAPVAVQGPARWSIPSEGTLVELADSLIRLYEAEASGE
ncbi:AIPR family protein [Parafrankia sp. FMc6]|uniref:AIPR family protein n=1 Tax=Parafrankia soli TaxID=2599596 RepID=UPI0034D6CF9B